MIARVTKGHGFAALARYLETGRDDANHSDRVVWTEARNIPTDDPHPASVLMRATAAQSARTEKPVYHIALSFNPADSVDRATMVQVADRLMNDLGLREHQALIIAHGDTRHSHVHLMINRVHPETFRAWHSSHDNARVERSLREQELGFRAVSGRHYRLDGQERLDRPEALAMSGEHQQQREQTPTEQAPRANEVNERQTTSRNVSEVVEPAPSSPERGADLTRAPSDGRTAPAEESRRSSGGAKATRPKHASTGAADNRHRCGPSESRSVHPRGHPRHTSSHELGRPDAAHDRERLVGPRIDAARLARGAQLLRSSAALRAPCTGDLSPPRP